jgi:hypothetical protein
LSDPAVHHARRSEIEARCLPWVARCSALAAGQVADARAHASQAITKSLVATPDGRATLSRSNRNRSLQAAYARLDELTESLAGPSIRSQDGTVRDAWEALYRDCRGYWLQYHIDTGGEDVLRPRSADGPSQSEVGKVRSLVLGGYDARTRVVQVIDPAKRRLRALVVAAASPSRAPRDRSGSLRAWEVATSKAVALAARNAILTGAFLIDKIAGRAVIRPELLHPDPTMGDIA